MAFACLKRSIILLFLLPKTGHSVQIILDFLGCSDYLGFSEKPRMVQKHSKPSHLCFLPYSVNDLSGLGQWKHLVIFVYNKTIQFNSSRAITCKHGYFL